MRIFGHYDHIDDAIAALIHHGVIAVAGARSEAVPQIERIMKCLAAYPKILPVSGYQIVPNHGYLYFVRDASRYPVGDRWIKRQLMDIDASDTRFLMREKAA
ncbi:hypothetical protein FNU76_05200 [Chitinimonas arctica]|uniref:Uncharacterized protein n=1 Tax=Chitinimonas arctica TaxID=2594795 RepID=A0A516SCC3_9NEIS|nr:hypothetical protein [Chitinimonas arctica]QDQ25795.1 hypothetical protein FNU76_05200 [Chitinimonas arctica]